MRIEDWSSDVCSSELFPQPLPQPRWGGGPTGIFQRLDRHGSVEGDVGEDRRGLRPEWPGAVDLDLTKGAHEHLVLGLGGLRPFARRLGTLVAVRAVRHLEIGKASCRERVCQYV